MKNELQKIKRPIVLPEKIIDQYIYAEHEWSSMRAYIRENFKEVCSDKVVSDLLKQRYSLGQYYKPLDLAWYLLEQYFAGKIEIQNLDESV